MPTHSFNDVFYIDTLSIMMMAMVGFIGMVVMLFASRYMQGDSHYNRFLWRLGLLILSVMILIAANNICLMMLAWLVSNSFLILLMIHKPQWRAALNAGLLTTKTFTIGFVCLVSALTLLYLATKEITVQGILQHLDHHNPLTTIAAILLVITAMTQSAIWPFHRWLLSSLNSPTPVSAIMHAGLVNGGGFILARFAPMYLTSSVLMNSLFILGVATACVGTLWKLMQHDVKRMLACSTMGQMGFMFAQCGLGLFPAAIAHLCWHGMFKANLFLSSNSTIHETRYQTDEKISLIKFSMAIICGLIGSYFFSTAIHSGWFAQDTTVFLIGIAFITASQFALALLADEPWRRAPTVILLTVLFSYLYGSSVFMMESVFQKINLFQPQPLNAIHILALIIFLTLWIGMVFKARLLPDKNIPPLLQSFYIKSLNASQPHSSTITSNRNDYRYN